MSGGGGPERTPRSARPDSSPYARGENVLRKLATPIRWGLGGLKKTVRSLPLTSALGARSVISLLLFFPFFQKNKNEQQPRAPR
jgi:hypothetical protein